MDVRTIYTYIYIYIMSFFFLAESRPPERHGLFCVMLDLAGSCRPAIRCWRFGGATNRGDSPRSDNKHICHFRCVFFPQFVVFFLSIKQSTGDPLRKIPDTCDLWLLGCPYLETVTQERVWDFLKSQSTWNPGKSTNSVDLYPAGN